MNESYKYVVIGHRDYTSTFTTYYDSRPITGSGQTVYNPGNNSRSGGDNPFWKSQVRACVQAGTAFSGTRYKFQPNHVHASVGAMRDLPRIGGGQKGRRECVYVSSGDGYLPVPYSWASSTGSQASNDAIRRVIKNAQRVQTQMSGMTFLGELGESVRMIRSPLKQFRSGIDDYFKSLKKVRRLDRRSRQAALTNTWLEFQYGWLPLAADIEDIQTSMRHLGTDLAVYKSISGSGTQEQFAGSTSGLTAIDGGGVNVRYYSHSSVDKSIRYKGVVRRSVTSDGPTLWGYSNSEFNRVFGLKLTLENFVPTVWELIPYSFLIDYFTNIGDVLNASVWDSSHVRWLIQTTRTTSKVIQGGKLGNTVHPYGVSGTRLDASVSTGLFEKCVVSRSVVDPRGLVPTLAFHMPGSNVRWMNIAALAAQHKSLTPFF